MKKLHIALATNNISGCIEDYSRRLGAEPCVVVADEYALWRTNTLNLSIRQDANCHQGELRHLGWEDPSAAQFTQETDVNGIVWENFNAGQQADEINQTWPGTDYQPDS